MVKDFASALRPALVLTLLFTLLLGFVYPALVTGIAQLAFPGAANGSLVSRGGKVIGSSLIGQAFAQPGYFHGRLSSAGSGYDATASSGSNLGPTSQTLHDRVAKDMAATVAEVGPHHAAIPADMLTSSASGLDPDVSPENAALQVPRIAAARHLDPARVSALVSAHVREPILGLLGEPHVNVLALNLALDDLASAH